jgi:S-DNA-T family DNA segregation ATPase FtsK/SpoIIIE
MKADQLRTWQASEDDSDNDPLLPKAREEIMRAGKASASLMQRRLQIGYARSARILDLLEQEGFIGPGDGAKPREIL